MEKLSKTSPDLESINIEQLKELFPSVVTEGKIDFDKLRILLGDEMDESNEKYQFTWHGKNNSICNAQAPSKGTLIPDSKSSKHFDETENLYIEGDNLEVLKLLQKTYYGKIKMIYIDPPYNTGNDFVYKDNFKDSIQNYKEQTSQTSRSNPETSGRYHTDWLNMMYPRLVLARNILEDKGAIFISIDDNELINLDKICSEIFGEKNKIGLITIQSNPRGSQSAKHLSKVHEYILVYAKNSELYKIDGIQKDPDSQSDYIFKDDKGNNYRLLGLRQRGGAWKRADRPKMHYPIYANPKNNSVSLLPNDDFTIEIIPARPSGELGRWTWGKEKLSENIDQIVAKEISRNGEIVWDIFRKDYLINDDGEEKKAKIKTIWIDKETNYQNGKYEMKYIFGSSEYFDYPKPTFLSYKLMKAIPKEEIVILDFFSGSATTAHAVMKLNAEDGGNRKFIMVQLPEVTDPESEAAKAGYFNICEIGKERIRRAGEKVKQELMDSVKKGESEVDPNQLDIGFKVFKLESTNIKEWDGSSKLTEDLLSMQEEVIKEGRTEQDVLYEVLLKYGVFDQPIETININNKRMYYLIQKKLLVCLADDITMDDITEIGKRKPQSVIFKESGFKDDNMKMNALYTLERLGVEDIKSL
jgi:adenine-specific DNA-methyltransferase